MSMKLADFHRLRKFMMLTQSGNDHEALQALRRANELLVQYSYDWNAVFARLVAVDVEEAEVEEAPLDAGRDRAREEKRRHVEQLFADVEPNVSGDFATFISQLRERWDREAFLSAGQLEALEKSAARQRQRQPGFRR